MKKKIATLIFWTTAVVMMPFYMLNEWAADNMD